MNIYFVGNSELINEFNTATIEECFDYLKDKKVLSLDIETTQKFNGKYPNEGLDPYVSNIVMVQIGDLDRQYVIDYRVIDIKILLPLLVDKNIVIVGQNLKFEYKFFLHNENIRLNNLYDTMIAEAILFNGLKPDISLKGLNKKYLNITVNKDTRLDFLTIKDNPFFTKHILYGAEDIYYPLLIREKQLKLIEEKKVKNCISLEMLFVAVLADIEYRGIHFDQSVWTEAYNKNLTQLHYHKQKLDEFVETHYKDTLYCSNQLDLFNPKRINCNINWQSPLQVTNFFVYLDIAPISKDTGKPNVNGKELAASLHTKNKNVRQEIYDFINHYLIYKEYERACSTFGIDFFKYVNPISNRVHSNYKQILNTGRISSSNPNLQNIPAEDYYRKAFSCPEGWNIINADYSGQEQIILANKSKDKDLIHFYEQNLGDMHKKTVHTKLGEFKENPIKGQS